MNGVSFPAPFRRGGFVDHIGGCSNDGGSPGLAVTGGIACGKSAFGRMLAELGADVEDADDVAHRLQEPGRPLAVAVRNAFGSECLRPDGGVDRPTLARIVFADPDKLATLNALSHPVIRRRLEEWRREPTDAWARFALVPLLFESGWEGDWDATICVTCSPETQLRRLLDRGLDEDGVRKRLAAQMPLSEKAARADIVVRNDGTLADLRAAALAVRNWIQEQAHP